MDRSKVISNDPCPLVSTPLFDSLPLAYNFLTTNRIWWGWKDLAAIIKLPYMRLHLAGWYAIKTLFCRNQVGEFYITRNSGWSRSLGQPLRNDQLKTKTLNPISSVQFSSVAQSCPTLRDPMDCSTPGFPVHHQLLELTKTHVLQVGDAIQPSHPLLSPSPPAFNLAQHQHLFKWVSSSHQVAKILEFELQHQFFQWTLRTDLL